MLVTYNGVVLQLSRTGEFAIRAVYDPSGLDLLYQEVTLSAICVWNPAATATNKPGAPVGYAGLGVRGDVLSTTISNLKNTLMLPRRQLTLSVGGRTTFFCPLVNLVTGNPMPCDPMGGPLPQHCRVIQIIGDKSAIVEFSIRFAVSDVTRVVTSCRWSVSATTDEAFLTTRSISGRASFRPDMLAGSAPTLVADQFRAALPFSVPNGFRRKRVSVVVNERGDESTFTIEDKEQTLNTGLFSPVIKIDGQVTTGIDTPIKDLKGVVSLIGDLAGDLNPLRAFGDPVGALKGVGSAASKVWSRATPSAKANGLVNVYGKAGADRNALFGIARSVMLDRFAPLVIPGGFRGLYPVSFFATFPFGNEQIPMVSIRAEFLCANLTTLAALFDTTVISKLVNTRNDINSVPLMKTDPTWGNLPFPASNGMRGRWLGELLTQVLSDPTTFPAAPVDVNSVKLIDILAIV